MTLDEITIESPSFNATNAGTMIRLPTAEWFQVITDVNPEEIAAGNDEDPIKIDAGAFKEVVQINGQITTKSATDTDIWNPTIIEGSSRTALRSAEEFKDLLRKTKVSWWKETVAGNWHNDGTPARKKGLIRVRLGYKDTGSLVPFYVYGYVAKVVFGPVSAGMKNARIIPYQLTFAYADVESV